jgi:hypothetical protein
MHESLKSARTLFVAARRGLPRQSSVEQRVSRRCARVPRGKNTMCQSTKRMRTSSQGSTSCGMQKLLDCSSSTPTLLHHDTAVWDDVRMSAVLSAARCIVFSYSSYQKSQKVKHRCPLCNMFLLVSCLLPIVYCFLHTAHGTRLTVRLCHQLTSTLFCFSPLPLSSSLTKIID